MSDSSKVRRILRVHSAHRTVGVSGLALPYGSCRRSERPSAFEPEIEPVRVMLVSDLADRCDHAALAAFERILLGRCNVECLRAPLAVAEVRGLAGADCAVVFGRCLQIVGHWSAFDTDAAAETGTVPTLAPAKMGLSPLPPRDANCGTTRVELADAARWHPLLDGVGPFTVSGGASAAANLRREAAILLVTRLADGIVPVAWSRHGDHRAVCTLLGRAEDFEQPRFVRLLMNAIEWVSR
jgi:hypothetical protein